MVNQDLAEWIELVAVRAASLSGRGGAVACEDLALDEGMLADSPLGQLCTTFGLDSLDAQLLGCLLAAEQSPSLRGWLRASGRDGGWLELGSIVELLGLDAADTVELIARTRAESPLLRHRLVLVAEGAKVGPAIGARLKLDETVARRLLGDDRLPAALRLCRGVAIDPATSPSLARVELDAVSARLAAAVGAQRPLVVELAGPRGCGRRRVALALGQAVGRPVLIADLDGLAGADLEATLFAAVREATLAGALLCLHEPRLIDERRPAGDDQARPVPRLAPELGGWLRRLEGPVLLTAETPQSLLDRQGPPVARVAVPFPTPSERAQILGREVTTRGAILALSDSELGALARRYSLDPSRLLAAATQAVADAPEEVDQSTLGRACQQQLSYDLGQITTRIPLVHRWEDLVVSEEVYHVLCEMIVFIEHAATVHDQWGFGGDEGRGPGVAALFAGPPGTGKTMCASVMARELGMELFRVDLSQMVSKWIGETEKNLSRLFDEAERSNAILLFDEADSLFAKRTEVKSSVDRYANLEVNYLLQRIESYSGVCILTTNFEDTLDPAVKRRLTFRARFEKPDVGARTALWRKAFPQRCPLSADISFERMGELFEISGGNIKNAVRRAAFAAAARGQVVDMATLVTAAERECTEMGQLMRDRSLDDPAGFEPVAVEQPATSAPVVSLPRAAAVLPPRLVPITHRRTVGRTEPTRVGRRA